MPTLPEWGMIVLGLTLLGIAQRRPRSRSKDKGQGKGGPGTLASLFGVLAGALMALSLAMGSAPVLADEQLTYDANGNVLTRTLPGGSTTYGYDALDRLNSEAGPAKTQSLGYDANGNRTSDAEGTKAYTASSDRLATLNGQAVSLDAAGNTLQARGYTYTWNQAGQLKTVSQGATLLATYFYDHRGLRSRKQTTAAAPQGAGTVVYHYDAQGRLLAETAANGAALVTYAWRDEVPVALMVPDAGVAGGRVLYLEVDHLGTPIAARNQMGRLVWKWESDAFGSTLANEDPDGDGVKTTVNLRFAGQYFDAESGLHYNAARYYDPRLGRYLSADPIGVAGGSNGYRYANANPQRYVDPDGRIPILPFLALGGLLLELDSVANGGPPSPVGGRLTPGAAAAKSAMVRSPAVAGESVAMCVAPSAARGMSRADAVIAETLASKGNLTSATKLSSDELLQAGEKFLGSGYKEIGKPGSGVFRSADGTRQFRIDGNSLSGNHAPGLPHGHLETYVPGAVKPTTNNHIPFFD